MPNFKKITAFLALLALPAMATQLKLPLTLRFSGGQHYLEWTGTNYGVSSSDTLTFYADTSGTPDAADPNFFLRSLRYAGYSPTEASQPGQRACQSYVLEVVAHAEADGSTAKFSLWKAQTAEGTLYQDSVTKTTTYSGATNDARQYLFPYAMQKYVAVKAEVTSATDSLVLQRATLWCSDVAPTTAAGGAASSVSVTSIDAGDNNIGNMDVASVVPGTGATNSGKAEDAAHTTGDVGTMALGVRRDANTTLADATGDYAPFQLDANGNLKVNIIAGAGSGGTAMADDAAFTVGTTSVTPVGYYVGADNADIGDIGAPRMSTARIPFVTLTDSSGTALALGSQYAEDAAHASGDALSMAGAVRRDTPTSSAGTDGDNATLNTDAVGRLWTNAGQAAHGAAITGNPVRTGLRAATAHPTAVASGDQVDQLGTTEGKAVVQPYAVRGETWSYAAASGGITDATAVTVKTAAGAGVRNCVTSIQVINGHATVSTDVQLVDGAAGTVLWRGFAQAAGGGAAAQFPVPLCGTANTLLEVDNGTTGSAVYYNVQGFESQE